MKKNTFLIGEKHQLRGDFFSIKAKPKTFFGLVPTQEVILLRCFLLIFDSSKTQLKKRDALK